MYAVDSTPLGDSRRRVHGSTEEGFLDSDGGVLFGGPEAERRFGKRHFIELTASFSAPPQFTALSGRTEVGRTDPSVLTEERPGPRRLLLRGRSWQVTYIDWLCKRVFVAVRGLKFSAAPPGTPRVATVAARLADFESARLVLGEPTRFQYGG